MDEDIVISDKERRNKEEKSISKFTKATVNAHCLLEVDPGKYNLDFKTNQEKNPAQIVNSEFEYNNHIISKWAAKAWLGRIN